MDKEDRELTAEILRNAARSVTSAASKIEKGSTVECGYLKAKAKIINQYAEKVCDES